MTAAHTARLDAANVPAYCRALADRAVIASRSLMTASGDQRTLALLAVAEAIQAAAAPLKQANARDLEAGEKAGLSSAMLDRLRLDDPRIAAMATSVRQIAGQTDPVGQIIDGYVRPNGLRLEKMRVPIGVILIIFESRPNVTSDAAALCIKSGNAVILRGGKEAAHSNTAIAQCIAAGLAKAGLDPHAVQLVATTDRAAVGELLAMEGRIDLCIPRGGKSLIQAVVDQARIPVIKHYTGNCHVYVDEFADPDMAEKIVINAKTQRPGVCNAAETVLFHQATVDSGLAARILNKLSEAGVEIRGCDMTRDVCPDAKAATDADWDAEYLDLIIASRVVPSADEAIDHINRHGSKHTDAIVTRDVATADRFVARVDSADVMVNCSTRFSDGGVYGLGAEIGISTDKLHARGPMGADDLTTYKWVVRGNGQIRG